MLDAGEFFAGRAADALGGGFRGDEIGKILFQVLEFLKELVVFAVGDDLAAFDVISVVVAMDFVREAGVEFFGFSVRHAGIVPGRAKEGKTFLASRFYDRLHACATISPRLLGW